jgi:bifunctional DNase/RNase
MKNQFIECVLKGIALEQETKMPIVLLENRENDRVLPICLMVKFLRKHHFRLNRLEIYKGYEDKHLARIIYRSAFKVYAMDLRPSDGIALALRFHAPILVQRDIFQGCTFKNEDTVPLQPWNDDILYLETEPPDSRLM